LTFSRGFDDGLDVGPPASPETVAGEHGEAGGPPVVVAVVTLSATTGLGPVLPAPRGSADEVVAAAASALVAGQTRPVDRVVPVPLAGPAPAGAIAQAMRQPGALPPDGGFVWLLDASLRPEPDALERLLACAALDPGAAVLGPVGITVDRAGRRRPAPGDALAVRDVLAVDRAGALIRVRAWRLLDGPNPLAGRADDLDLCWRAWRAGLRVTAVPAAHVPAAHVPAAHVPAAHVPAAHSPAATLGTGGGPAGVERVDASRVRLAQAGPVGIPAALVSLLIIAFGRAAVELVRGRGSGALTELTVLGSVLADPARLWRLARRCRHTRRMPARALRALLPRPGHPPAASPPSTVTLSGVPLSAVPLSAVPTPGGRSGATNRAVTAPAAGLADLSARRGGDGTRGTVARPLARPTRPVPTPRLPAVLAVLLAVAAGWALTGTGRLGGRGAPLPPGAADLWAAVWSGWVGPAGGLPGGPGPAPPWTPLLAALSAALGGRPELTARVLLVATPALAGLAAYRAAWMAGARRPWARLGLAACYAFAPPVTAAALAGDLPAVGASVAAPLVLGGAVGLLAPAAAPGGDEEMAGGWPRAWALAAALFVGVACSPRLLLVAAVGLVAGALATRPAGAGRSAAAAGGASTGPSPAAVRVGRGRRRAGQVAVVVAAGCAPLLPALWVAARAGKADVLSVLADEPAPKIGDGYPLAAFALAAALAAVACGRAARPAVGVCWLVAAAGWVTGQDAVAAAALVGTVGVAWSACLRPAGAVSAGAVSAGPVSAGAASGGRRAGIRAGGLTALVILAPAMLFARAAGALGSPPDPVGWAVAGPLGTAGPRDGAGRVLVAAVPGDGRTLVLRPSTGGVSYTLTGGHGPTVVDAAGGPARPAAEFIAAVVADLTVGGGWGAAALPSLGAGAVFVPTRGGSPVGGGPVGGVAGVVGADDPTGPAGRLVAALDASDGLERDQTRSDGYSWRLAPAAGPAAGARVLPPGLAAAARAGSVDRSDGPAGSVPAARSAPVDRVATGPGVALAATRAPGDLPARTASTSTDGQVPAGPAGRLLVLAEPADAGWRASLAGRSLTPVAAWGWAQAFEVPAGPAAEVRVRYDHTPHRVLVAIEAALAGAVALGWASSRAWGGWRRRRAGAAVWWAGR